LETTTVFFPKYNERTQRARAVESRHPSQPALDRHLCVPKIRFGKWAAIDIVASLNRTREMTLSSLTSEQVDMAPGAVAGVVEIEVGVVSGVFNLESSGVDAPDWRPRHDEH